MLKSKEEFVSKLESMLTSCKKQKKPMTDVMDILYEEYNVPTEVSKDILALKIDLEFVDISTLFFIMYVINDKVTKSFFTQEEIDFYLKNKFKVEKVKFPIVLNMAQVSDDQWIGVTTVKTLMKYRDAQLINYNENAQRILQKKTINGVEVWKLSLNKEAVYSIQDSFDRGAFIPNTITLNIPMDSIKEYKDGKLYIHELSSFDILDGYHRYIGMSKETLKNPDFDYPMELRITCFPDERAQQFIHQEDQKTQMSKVDSNSYNISAPGNKVTTMLSQAGITNGLINRNNGIIDYATLSNAITANYFYIKKLETQSRVMTTRDEVYSKLNDVIETDYALMDNKWSTVFTNVLITVIANHNDLSGKEILNRTNNIINSIKENRNLFETRTLTRSIVNQIIKVDEKAGD